MSLKETARNEKRPSHSRAEKPKIIFMFDFDGTLFKTMHLHAKLAAEVIHKHFGIPLEEAKRDYLSTSGISFPKQIEKLFPGKPKEKREACIREYKDRRIKEVFELAEPFPEIRETLDRLKEGYPLMVSSGNEGQLIHKFLGKSNLDGCFKRVYGSEAGLKEEHIKAVMNEFNPQLIVFVGDSPYDMQLSSEKVITVGKAGRPEEGMLSKEELIQEGADLATADLMQLAEGAKRLEQANLSSMDKKKVLAIFIRGGSGCG